MALGILLVAVMVLVMSRAHSDFWDYRLPEGGWQIECKTTCLKLDSGVVSVSG